MKTSEIIDRLNEVIKLLEKGEEKYKHITLPEHQELLKHYIESGYMLVSILNKVKNDEITPSVATASSIYFMTVKKLMIDIKATTFL